MSIEKAKCRNLNTMALILNETDCYQFIECMYKCKHYKTNRSKRFKEHRHHIFGYRYRHDIFVLEQIQESQRHTLLKYNNKRCSCKMKKKQEKNDDNIHRKDRIKIINTCDFLGQKSSSNWRSPFFFEPYNKPLTRQSTKMPLYSSLIITSLNTQSDNICANISTPCISRFPIMYDSDNWNTTETVSNYCDIPSNYLNSQINLLSYKRKETSSQQHYQNFHFHFTYFYLLMTLIIKEIFKYVSKCSSRMRRKTQLLLPMLFLLQLFMTVSLTNCTSPPNQTIAAVVSSSSTFVSSSVALVSDIISTSFEETMSSKSATTSTMSNNEEKVKLSAHKIPDQHITAPAVTSTSYRPSGGSSITSYISKIRRDPNLSFTSSGCHSCRMREQVKADNLESIKRHILLRLEMQTLPNITAPPVPFTIIENFYKNDSYLNTKKIVSDEDRNSNSEKTNLVYTTLSLSQSNDYMNKNENENSDNMQGDDPNTYAGDYNYSGEQDDEKNEQIYRNNFEDEFYSIVNSVYVFPSMPRMRHSRKTEILNFKFKSIEHSSVSQALLYVYIRGRDWIREYEPELFGAKGVFNSDRHEIIVTVNRVVRRVNSTIATHTVNVTESQHKIPNGLGQWISIDVTQLVQGWLRNATTNQGIIIKGSENWMKPFITTGDSQNNKEYTVYIEMLKKDNRKRRTKRNTSMNCSESDNEERCCRYPLVVNFIEFDWTWVVAPTSFNAYFCNGECKLGFLEKYPHTHLMQLSTAPQPCCSPTKMSPLRLLYFNAENTLVMSTIPNMAVEKCSCS